MVLNTGNTISGLTVTANGGNGGNAWPTNPPVVPIPVNGMDLAAAVVAALCTCRRSPG